MCRSDPNTHNPVFVKLLYNNLPKCKVELICKHFHTLPLEMAFDFISPATVFKQRYVSRWLYLVFLM